MNRWDGGKPAALLFVGLVFASFTITQVWSDDRPSVRGDAESSHLRPDVQATQLLAARCAVCHSTDLITQQRLTRIQWDAIVQKMVQWGAQLSDTERDVLVTYLAARYHARDVDKAVGLSQPITSEEPAGLATGAQGPGVRQGPAGNGEWLFTQHCAACHGAAAVGGVGPTLARNPIVDHERQFWDTVTNGRGAMPPWGSILNAQEITNIRTWLKTLQ